MTDFGTTWTNEKEEKMLRDVTIKAALNGWIVKVGCQTLVFNDTNKMLDEIEMYLESPEKVERRYRERALNAKHTFDGAEAVEETLRASWGDDIAERVTQLREAITR